MRKWKYRRLVIFEHSLSVWNFKKEWILDDHVAGQLIINSAHVVGNETWGIYRQGIKVFSTNRFWKHKMSWDVQGSKHDVLVMYTSHVLYSPQENSEDSISIELFASQEKAVQTVSEISWLVRGVLKGNTELLMGWGWINSSLGKVSVTLTYEMDIWKTYTFQRTNSNV